MDVTEISARLGILELTSRYTDAIVREDIEACRDCWTEDAAWHVAGNHLRGRDEIIAFYQKQTGGWPHVRHLAHNPILRIKGQKAEGRWQITETLCAPDGSSMLFLGVYEDTYACEDGTWRFAERRLEFIYRGPLGLKKDLFTPLGKLDRPF